MKNKIKTAIEFIFYAIIYYIGITVLFFVGVGIIIIIENFIKFMGW